MKRGFTLIELLASTGVIAVLMALLLPSIGQGRGAAWRAICSGNLRQLYAAQIHYFQDNEGQFFPWRENTPEGILWYFGLETPGGTEGHRLLDKSRARLAPYLGANSVETCPAFPYKKSLTKQKYELASYGYGINYKMLRGATEASCWSSVQRPAQTVMWGDAAQINDFQAPASKSNPMLEEWYELSARANSRPTFHFRHNGQIQLAMADGSVRAANAFSLIALVDRQVGYLEAPNSETLLALQK